MNGLIVREPLSVIAVNVFPLLTVWLLCLLSERCAHLVGVQLLQPGEAVGGRQQPPVADDHCAAHVGTALQQLRLPRKLALPRCLRLDGAAGAGAGAGGAEPLRRQAPAHCGGTGYGQRASSGSGRFAAPLSGGSCPG